MNIMNLYLLLLSVLLSLTSVSAAASEGLPSKNATHVSGVKTVQRRKLPPVTMTMNIPPAGSLQHIYGQVVGLENPQLYRFCVYLESNIATFNGPKPFEDEGSFAPLDANGNYDYVNWWAHNIYDVITPKVYGFIWPNAYGNCIPTIGGPNIDPEMFTGAVVWMQLNRVVPFTLQLQTPAMEAASAVGVQVRGIPAGLNAANYNLMIFGVTPNGISGPLPTCGSVFPLTSDEAVEGGATGAIASWAQGAPALANTLTGFRVVLVPGPYNEGTDGCLNNAPAIPPSWPVIAQVAADRGIAFPPPVEEEPEEEEPIEEEPVEEEPEEEEPIEEEPVEEEPVEEASPSATPLPSRSATPTRTPARGVDGFENSATESSVGVLSALFVALFTIAALMYS